MCDFGVWPGCGALRPSLDGYPVTVCSDGGDVGTGCHAHRCMYGCAHVCVGAWVYI